jgi:superfamily II DNA/RNA helicase
MDHLSAAARHWTHLQHPGVDEADCMLDMGFFDDIA